MRTHSKRALVLLLTVLGSIFLSAGLRPAGATPGTVPPASGPVAGPIEVLTMAEVLPTPLGNLLETTIVVENHGGDPALVFLLGRITWPDGSTQLLRYGPPVTIAPDGAFVLSALSPIPDSVGPGTGSFGATAFVGALGTGGRRNSPGRLIAHASSTFELP